MFYLDACATAPLRPGVLQRMVETQDQAWANPSSLHQFGLKASEALERARSQIAAKLSAEHREVVFTSGATESIHLALHGLAASRSPGRLVISSVEHPAVSGAARLLSKSGWDVTEWPVDQLGRIRLEHLDQLLAPPTKIVSLVWGQGEVGTIQPLLTVAEACRTRGIPIHTDATQILSQALPSWKHLPVDLLSSSAHKCGGPRGIGLLMTRESYRSALKPLLSGGGQEGGLRSGTESVVLAVGMAAALDQIECCPPDDLARSGHGIADLRDALRDRLLRDQRLMVCGDPQDRLPHHLSLLVSDHNGQPVSGRQLVRSLDACGLAVSSGSACSSGKDSDSPVLASMGLPQMMRRSSIRISLGPWIEHKDLDGIVQRFHQGLEETLCS
ncbi:cysteine desulfurase family protein [Synechococcus sp. UW179A]|uniref:cysteine desulfurase family protein n=1 Tax=Synechococcus sp. UW179A TaxID=2575510 RepID=UPI001FCC9193|nr:cysteine desulfurase family protein [Synechococcus sp. UW179A]